jgi:hypothetical protein
LLTGRLSVALYSPEVAAAQRDIADAPVISSHVQG